jgi:hypothetical protein
MSWAGHACPNRIPLPSACGPVYGCGRNTQALIRPSAEHINAIADTMRDWPADARARLIERLKAADAERSTGHKSR